MNERTDKSSTSEQDVLTGEVEQGAAQCLLFVTSGGVGVVVISKRESCSVNALGSSSQVVHDIPSCKRRRK